jgi:hypothetical protein
MLLLSSAGNSLPDVSWWISVLLSKLRHTNSRGFVAMTRRQIFDRTIDVPLPDGPREDPNFAVRVCHHCGQSVRFHKTFNGWRCLMCGRFTKDEKKGGA